jgi:hypothetical protein
MLVPSETLGTSRVPLALHSESNSKPITVAAVVGFNLARDDRPATAAPYKSLRR